MRVLVVGSGAREHALCWKIAQSKLLDKLFCAPGNAGIARIAECIDIKADDINALLQFSRTEKIDLTVVGPEAPLALGIVDEFIAHRLRIFGPSKRACQLEASKIFAKELMLKYNVPTASFKIFDDPKEAKKYLREKGVPCVIKADGLAAGKGVVVAKDFNAAEEAIDLMLEKKIFGKAGERIIIEDCLNGEEASILVITDGKSVVPLASSQDHKRVFDNDQGPNTGGMGAYSPAPLITGELFSRILDEIIHPTLRGLAKEDIKYQGVLYFGIMVTDRGPKVLEFNVRFGDPETEAILPRLKSDLLEVMFSTCEEKLNSAGNLVWDNRACVCVVLASQGYPGVYAKDKEIFGLEEAEKLEDTVIFHAGTKRKLIFDVGQKPEIEYRTDGGRVLAVVALGEDIPNAIIKTYTAVSKISFEGMHFRKDIGRNALKRLGVKEG